MPVLPTCFRSSGHVPLYGALALSKPHRPQSCRPCHDRVFDPLALAVVALCCVPPRHVAPELVIAEPELRPMATPFFTPNQTLGSPHLCRDACCRATVHHRPPFFVPLPRARHQFRLAVVATSTMSCLCAHPRSQGPVFWAGAPGQPSTRTNACE
jgi:hypothetical protein